MKKIIVIEDCDSCPYVEKCKPWKKLSGSQRFQLTCGVGVGKFILKGCPLPDGDEKLEVFEGI